MKLSLFLWIYYDFQILWMKNTAIRDTQQIKHFSLQTLNSKLLVRSKLLDSKLNSKLLVTSYKLLVQDIENPLWDKKNY